MPGLFSDIGQITEGLLQATALVFAIWLLTRPAVYLWHEACAAGLVADGIAFGACDSSDNLQTLQLRRSEQHLQWFHFHSYAQNRDPE